MEGKMTKIRYKDKLRILHVASELTPIAKAGGLGDVVGAMPKELAREFHMEVRIIIPRYKNIDHKKYPSELIIKDLKIPLADGSWQKISLWKTFIPETIIPVYLIDCPRFFPGDDIYGHKLKDLPDS